MFRLFANDEPTKLDDLIATMEIQLDIVGPYSEDYNDLLKRLERLYDLKAQQRPKKVSPDTLALIAGNLAGILLIVAYEQKHVITSKGFSQIVHLNKTNN